MHYTSVIWLLVLFAKKLEAVGYNNSFENRPIVRIPQLGLLEGTMSTSATTGRSIFMFMGVNYAIAPSNNSRFQPPQPFKAWEGIYNASLMRQPCPQVQVPYYPQLPPHRVHHKNDTEDCLVVNVYTPMIPRTSTDKLLPVLFYIHGGSFYMGSAQDFGPEYLLEKDIVLVVPQYRLGVLGFSSLGTDSIAGNAGMLDIVLALEWVKDNIKWFGGDAQRVTVAGQSAGAAAATALLVSPLVPPGLISAMIVQSGSVEASWAVSKDPVPALLSIAQSAGCFSTDKQEIADCLRKTSVEGLLKAHLDYISLGVGESTKATALVVQNAGAQKFLVYDPDELLASGNFSKVPIMVGTTRDDGSAFFAEMLPVVAPHTPFSRNLTKALLKVLSFGDQSNAVIDIFHEKFFKNCSTFADAFKQLNDLFGVFIMKAPTYSIARRMYQFKPTYMYSFDFLGNASKLRRSEPDWDTHTLPIGVAHSDELGYLFPIENYNYSSRELKMVDTMVNLWGNFIISQRPAPTAEVKTWSAVADEFGPYLRIGQRSQQFNNIYREYEVTVNEGFAHPSPTLNGASQMFPLIFSHIFIILYFKIIH